jgi:SAM-dependent methyltransferase
MQNYRELLIGCGRDRSKKVKHTPFEWQNLITLDSDPDRKPDITWDLELLPLPFADDQFDEIHAYEVLEHTGSQGDYRFFFAQFSEFWRILRPNGFFIGTVPMWTSPWAWGDPGHKRIIPKESFVFLDQSTMEWAVAETEASDYGGLYNADFKSISLHEETKCLTFVLQAIKPSRKKG